MMISETGSFAGGQASYFQQMKDQLSPTGDFPLIKAVLYFDAPGQGGLYTYPLDQSGLGEFESLSASPMFQPSRSASTVAVDASPASSMVGHRVVLDAQLSNTDFGGSTTFFVNGTPLPGCESLPATAVSWCNTTSLPAGNNSITAIYSGDAEVAGSTATTLSKVTSSRASGALGLRNRFESSSFRVPTLPGTARHRGSVGTRVSRARRSALLLPTDTEPPDLLHTFSPRRRVRPGPDRLGQGHRGW